MKLMYQLLYLIVPVIKWLHDDVTLVHKISSNYNKVNKQTNNYS